MNITRRSILFGVLAASAMAGHAQQPQNYPNKPIRFIIPYGAGGSGDVAARSVGEAMGKMWGQPFIVDNRPGGNEIVAAQMTAASPGDGYTFLMASEATASVNAHLYSKLPYDPQKDLIPVARMLTSPYVLVAGPDFPANSLKEFIDEVKRNPGKYNFGSQGIGGPNHLAMAWLGNITGMKIEHVPYKTLPQGIQEVMSGRVEAMFGPVGTVSPYVKSGKLKALAIAGKSRQSELPAVPTFAESGFPTFDASFYLAVFAPKGTPPEIVQRFARDMRKVITDPAFVKKYFQPQAYEPVGDTPEEFTQFLRKDREVAAEKVRLAGAKLD